jgi:hypothetical protein
MERVRALTRRARVLLAAGLAAAAASGCVTTRFASVQTAVANAIAPEKPAPATEFACGWQNRLATLPDPTRNGALVPGVVGQVFLYSADYKPADVGGDLTLTVHDATPRPPGAPAMRPEVWHFTKDVLRKLAVADERFGRSLVVFLPWPESWRDVNRLHIQARYDQPGESGGHTLFAQPSTVTLDFSSPGGHGAPAAAPAVPDPAVLLKHARAAAVAQPQGPPPGGASPGPAGGFGAFAPPAYTQPMTPQQPVPGTPPPAHAGWAPQTAGGYAPQPTAQPPYYPQPAAGWQPPPAAQPHQPAPPPNELLIPRRR